ncbi:MAG TPA: GAF domain-containing protein [Nitrococcus sp.]|nr:GAF domain-containing protein [Nitrococcus sp.]
MIQQPLHILHLESDSNDAQQVQAALIEAGLDCRVKVVATGDEYLAALSRGKFDLILADEGIPGCNGLSTWKAARKRCPGIPFIFVSRLTAERDAEQAGATGPAHCVPKRELERLAPAVKRALQLPAAAAAPQGNLTAANGQVAEYLVATVQQLSLTRDLQSMMSIVCQAARTLTGADGAAFILRAGEYCHCAEENAIAPLWKGRYFPMATFISGWVMQNRQAAVVEDIYSDARIAIDVYRSTFIKGLAVVPIRTEAPVGAIGCYWGTRHQARPDEVKWLQALADSSSIAMENIWLSKRLQILSQRLLETAENERRHIARELHDEIGQPLMAIHINLQSNKLCSESMPLRASIEIAERLCQKVQELSSQLYPALLDDLGLVCALTWYLRQATRCTSLQTRFHTDLGNSRFGQETEIICFRVAQEAIKNAINHAMARSLSIELRQQNNRLCLTVADDGIGYGLRAEPQLEPCSLSLGLLSMQERASLIGGDVRITSVPGQGTCIRGYFPLN